MKNTIRRWMKRMSEVLSIQVLLDPEHPMVRLKDALDWQILVAIAEKHRQAKIKNGAGRKPSTRTQLGAVVVRILESCTLRKASDLMRHYGPARYLCGLDYSPWTPNFRTLSDFEILLGAAGLQEINNYVISVARTLGFADITGLCSDTTAQEAAIPYPNDVGLMGAFARSVDAAVKTINGKAGKLKDVVMAPIERVRKLVRKHRLFCKSNEAKQKTERDLLTATQSLARSVGGFIDHVSESTAASLKGSQKKAFARLGHLTKRLVSIVPEIKHYVENRSAVAGKTVSLFLTKVKAIVRGKIGKKVEFGLKWGVNQIRGGYVALFRCDGKSEYDCAVMGVEQHIKAFGQPPLEYGFDRGGWSTPHMEKIRDLGVKRIAIAPKGKAKWKVPEKCKIRMTRERAQVEGIIGTMKMYEFNRPHAKTEGGMERSALRSGLRFNLTKLLKDTGRR